MTTALLVIAAISSAHVAAGMRSGADRQRAVPAVRLDVVPAAIRGLVGPVRRDQPAALRRGSAVRRLALRTVAAWSSLFASVNYGQVVTFWGHKWRPNVVKASIVVEARFGAEGQRALDRLIELSGMEIVPVDVLQARAAREACLRFGKGRHAAGLNFGDCSSYALATVLREPLLVHRARTSSARTSTVFRERHADRNRHLRTSMT